MNGYEPATQLPPDVLTGLLPPEDGTGRGMGHVSFLIKPKSGLATGTAIRNVAVITFDRNVPITTDQIDPLDASQGIDPAKQALVTIDADRPNAGVNTLPASVATASFPVSWSGTDGAGSGIAFYDVFVSDNGGPFAPWLSRTTLTSANYAGQNGHTYRFHAVATDNVGWVESSNGSAEATTTVNVPPPPPPPPPPGTAGPLLVGYQQFAVGAGGGSRPEIRFFDADRTELISGTMFPARFACGVRTASGDFDGDGIADLVVGTGPGAATAVAIIDGFTGDLIFQIAPFVPAFTGGVYVSAGDLTGDGRAELVISPDEGGGPRVQVYSGFGYEKIADFFGIDDTNFRGGARSAIGDFNGDGSGDLVVAAGFGGGPRVSVISGITITNSRTRLFGDFFLFEEGLRNGAFVAVGDVDGDGFADIVGGGGPGGGPRVYALSGADLLAGDERVLANFFAGNVENRSGIRVSVKDLDGDARADVVVGDGTGAGSRVTGYLGKHFAGRGAPEAFAFDAFPGFTGGVFVG